MYQQIANNKRKTFMFIIIFIILISVVSYIAGEMLNVHNPYLFAIIGFIVSFFTSFISYYFSDSIVLAMSHAKPVTKQEEPYLYNTVEGVAIAAGIPMPKLYIMEIPIPNAFATGRNPEKGAIAVTRGLLDMMNREELEGVIAHEMSHIKNYDILFATLIAVMAGVLIFISHMATRSMFLGGRRRDDDSKNNSNPILMVIGLILIILVPIIAKILQFSMSRNREYLADATAASLLGYPMGLASALEKLGKNNTPRHAKEYEFDNNAITALCIVNPLKSGAIDNIFSTHPSIDKRIERLKSM